MPKTEMWLLCASGLLPRGLPMRTETIDDSVAEKMTRMFGTDIWLEALKAAAQNHARPAPSSAAS